jgi:AraC-like DNA-binding protein
MPRPIREPPLSSSLVPAILRHARSRGLDVDALALRVGIPANAWLEEEVLAPAEAPEEMLHAVGRAAFEPEIALAVAAELRGGPCGRHALAEIAVRASATVGDALLLLARWVPLLHEGFAAALAVEDDAAEARWVLRTPRRPRGLGGHVHELALAHAVGSTRDGAADAEPTRVFFAHARPRHLDALKAFFGTKELAFGADESGFALPRRALEHPMRRRDALTVTALTPVVDAALGQRGVDASFADRVAKLVASSLPGPTSIDDIAGALSMSPRTLQRRLEHESTSFSDVLDAARLRASRGVLADPTVTLTEAAYRLGFADLATFTRAFKRWTGMPPGQWRRS